MKTMSKMAASLIAFPLLWACSAPPILTVTVYESGNQVVRLQAMPDANGGKGYSHPAFLSEETVAAVLSGLFVEEDASLIPLPLAVGQSRPGTRSRAFGDAEARFLAPLLVKGLSMATPDELVTFYETEDISRTQRVVNSGGVFVIGEELHIVLSNHATKVNIWQDTDQYEAPYRMRPLEPISPEPGRLLFEPPRHMIPSQKSGFAGPLQGGQLHVGVRFREIQQASAPGATEGSDSSPVLTPGPERPRRRSVEQP